MLGAVGASLLVFLCIVFFVFWMPNEYGPSGVVVTIPRGSTFRAAVDSLERTGAIRSAWAFNVAGRLAGYTRSIKVGKYLFRSSLSNLEILRDLGEGKSRMIIAVTIPEGWRMESIAKKFSRELGIDSEKFLSFCADSLFLSRHNMKAKNIEGYLMPETYNFYWQTDELEIFERMVEGMQDFYVDSLSERAKELGLSMNQVLTLASIIEGESGIDEERPMIAGVYWNRLKRGMKLEADPTIQYVIPNGPRRLMYDDLKFRSPYNTYLVTGLPPGPINNPGKRAILAALYPERHSFLYFVATGVGGHHFSKNYSDHRKAVQSFRRVRRELQHQSAQGG